jgi:hypothetical protein
MAIATSPAIFVEIIDFLASSPTPQQIIDFKPSDELQNRSHELLEHNRQGTLTAEERAEMEEFRRMSHFMNMLKIRARQKIEEQ